MPASNPPGNGSITTAHLASKAVTLDKVAGDVLPAGCIQQYAGSVAPTGWLICQGQEISQSTYADLFAILGTTYNHGNEAAGNFRLPDLQGRIPVGKGTHTEVSSIGLTEDGNKTGQALANRRPKHGHTVNAHRHDFRFGITDYNYTAAGPNAGLYNAGAYKYSTSSWAGGSLDASGISMTVDDNIAAGSTGVVNGGRYSTTGDTNTSSPGTDAQGPSFLVVNYIIKV